MLYKRLTKSFVTNLSVFSRWADILELPLAGDGNVPPNDLQWYGRQLSESVWFLATVPTAAKDGLQTVLFDQL